MAAFIWQHWNGPLIHRNLLLPIKKKDGWIGIWTLPALNSPNTKLLYRVFQLHFQETFLQNVRILEEEQEQVKVKCAAGFMSEDSMRDEGMKELSGLW